jgi:hypothetical protein
VPNLPHSASAGYEDRGFAQSGSSPGHPSRLHSLKTKTGGVEPVGFCIGEISSADPQE